ncbi:MAG: hypothetical protein GF309_09850 [Candidatus Lokiarchaeota archaeon]|nr:hypothetical protein [Candidatus Lokiarchaeota archaeon]
MTEEISNNWKITADWDIEYELKAKWWGCIRVEVWYSVRDSSGGWVWGFQIWYDECKSYGTSWVTERGTYSEESDQGFGQDLDDGKTYRFCVELRVKVVNGGAVMAHSYYSDSNPVKLTVDEISWGYLV